MAFNPDTYEPVYVDLNDFPIQGPDDYSQTEKRRAAFEAETRMESDVNAGKRIPEEFRTRQHSLAVLLFGTYRLVDTAEHPEDVTLGDVESRGVEDEDTGYAQGLLDDYKDLISLMEEVGEDGSKAHYYGAVGDGTGRSTAVNTRERIIDEYPFDEDDRFPKEDFH